MALGLPSKPTRNGERSVVLAKAGQAELMLFQLRMQNSRHSVLIGYDGMYLSLWSMLSNTQNSRSTSSRLAVDSLGSLSPGWPPSLGSAPTTAYCHLDGETYE